MSKKKSGPDKGSPFAALQKVKEELERQEARAKAEAAAKGKPAPKPRVVPGAAKKNAPPPGTSEDDALAFHRLMSGVTPLDRTHTRIPQSLAEVDREPGKALGRAGLRAAEDEAQLVEEHLRALVEGGSRFEVSDDGRRVEGKREDVPPDWVRKLRRGLLPIDARLDLHGLGAEAARTELETFLRDKRARGERCVLVIHGKGEHSEGPAVLRGEIAAWLAQGRASASVAAFTTALPQDGGEGAVYVLLRR